MGPDQRNFSQDKINKINKLHTKIRKLRQVLPDLYEPLEQYAPIWYTKDHRERVRNALYPSER